MEARGDAVKKLAKKTIRYLIKKSLVAPVASRKALPGQALVLVAGVLMIAVLLLGLLIEVGHLYIVQRGLQNDADGAAAVGAMQLDIRGLRDSNGSKVENDSTGDVSDPTAAGQQVEDYLSRLGYQPSDYSWEWRRCQLRVSLKRNVPTIFVSIFGFTHTEVEVSSKAVIYDSPTGCD